MPLSNKNRSNIAIRKEAYEPDESENQFKVFEKNLARYGRAVIMSEEMAMVGKNVLGKNERYKIYSDNVHQLLRALPVGDQGENKTTFEECRRIFNELKLSLLKDPKYYEKYVAIVDGILVDSDDVETELVRRMFKKFGNAEMYIGKITPKSQKGMIESPEQR